MAHPPRIPVWLRCEQAVVYFVTLCVARREPVLANPQTLTALHTAAAKLEQWKILAAVLMPDHLHFMATPVSDRNANVSDCSAALKRWIRQELNAPSKWQPGFRPLTAKRRIAAEQVVVLTGESGSRRLGKNL